MSRYTAAFIHLLISLAVFAVLAYLLIYVWFPDFFYTIDGGWEGMRIIIFVDLVLGPLLTLIVYKAGKPGLKFDMAAIALFQSICLAAGTYIVHSERPLFFIYYDKHFYSASTDTYTRYDQRPPDPAAYGGTPAFVISTVPDNPIEEADFRRILYQDELPIWVYARSYRPLAEYKDHIIENEYDIEDLQQRDVDNVLPAFLEKHGGTLDDYAFYPVHSRYVNPFIAIRKDNFQFVDILNISAPFSNEPEGD